MNEDTSRLFFKSNFYGGFWLLILNLLNFATLTRGYLSDHICPFWQSYWFFKTGSIDDEYYLVIFACVNWKELNERVL